LPFAFDPKRRETIAKPALGNLGEHRAREISDALGTGGDPDTPRSIGKLASCLGSTKRIEVGFVIRAILIAALRRPSLAVPGSE